MLLKRQPKDGEVVKINPKFVKEIIPEILIRNLNYEKYWEDLSVKYKISQMDSVIFRVIPISIADDMGRYVWINRQGLYLGGKEELNIPMFMTIDSSSQVDSRYCNCGSTPYKIQPMFNSIIKICQECGKDKKE